jgi:hypothetical protein
MRVLIMNQEDAIIKATYEPLFPAKLVSISQTQELIIE